MIMASQKNELHVGLCGAGIGGLAAAISIARGGARVTVLEAAAELGEIGAGIQMTPNVSRLLIRWGVSDIIGEDLVQCDDIKMRRMDGKVIAYTELVPRTCRELGFPWWVVHRHHLHQGLSEAARRHGAEIIIDARVTAIDYDRDGPVKVTTYLGKQYEFDLLIGSDGLKSVVRKSLFPDIRPRAPTTNAAYRAVLPYEKLFSKHPDLKDFFGNTIDVWLAENGYAISYPISGGKDLNLVLSHHRDAKVEDVEDVNIEDLHSFYRHWDPRLVKVVEMVNESKRWPLLVTGPLKSWSSPKKNVVLMGDAAHSMVNHMAQGAATSMEDGAFLGRIISEVMRGILTLPEAIDLYEQKRMPRAFAKQQASFLMGATYHLAGPKQQARDASSEGELSGAPHTRSWNLWGSPHTMPHIYSYDAESDADFAVVEYLQNKSRRDPNQVFTAELEDKWLRWFLDPESSTKRNL